MKNYVLTCNCKEVYKASNKRREKALSLIETKSSDGTFCDFCGHVCYKRSGHVTREQSEANAKKLQLLDPKFYAIEKGKSHVGEWHKRNK